MFTITGGSSCEQPSFVLIRKKAITLFSPGISRIQQNMSHKTSKLLSTSRLDSKNMKPPRQRQTLLLPLFITVTLLLSSHITNAFTVYPKHNYGSMSRTAQVRFRGPIHDARSFPASITSRTGIYSTPESSMGGSGDTSDDTSTRGKLRQITGFSLTAMRSTMRAATGFSLTTLRATLRVTTGISVTGTMRAIMSILPLWFRFFLQPFLIMYYVPLLMLRGLIGPTKTYKSEAMAAHQQLVSNWSDAIKAAEAAQKGGYWPVHVDGELLCVIYRL
uniref:Uncharacterized protein n=1 Tax=Ditylum brightwellii TaxID=49249 RepID=A0A7S4V692_9STRA|mmetsp:Transcript_54386/g.80927  ORF Transcript_54386/g.80927 Transcript_54386/m.80927 type:complete len:275 (+) Transcript_54386:5-829(+)